MHSHSISLKYAPSIYFDPASSPCQKTHQGWKEVLLTSAHDPAAKTILRPSPSPLASASLDPSASSPKKTRFRPVLAPESTPVSTLLGASSPRFASLPIGARIEVSAASFQTARKLGALVSQGAGGSALVVDYGADHAVGNSFRVREPAPSLLDRSDFIPLAPL